MSSMFVRIKEAPPQSQIVQALLSDEMVPLTLVFRGGVEREVLAEVLSFAKADRNGNLNGRCIIRGVIRGTSSGDRIWSTFTAEYDRCVGDDKFVQ